MKKYLKISAFLLLVMLVFTCTSPEGETNYTPSTYLLGSDLTITVAPDFDVDGVTALETSFKVDFTATEVGTAYYAVFPGGSDSPSIEDIVELSTSGLSGGKVDLTAGATSSKVIEELEPGYSYDVYAATVSVDGFAGTSREVASYTTPDETAPEFIAGDSSPARASSPNDPFLSSVTFAFSEQVFYQGGDITLYGYFNEITEIVFTADDLDPSSAEGGKSITFNTSEQWSFTREAIIGLWDAGTFVDNVGNPIAALEGFDYFFYTRDFTITEKVESNLIGDYDYTLTQSTFSGVPEEGQYTVTNNGDEITVFNFLPPLLGESNEHVLRVGNDDDNDGVGLLFAVEVPQRSSPDFWVANEFPPMYWHPYFNDIRTAHAGFYDLNTGEIIYLYDLATVLGWQDPDGVYLGAFEYNMLPASTGGRSSSREEGEGLRNHPVVKQYFEDIEAYRISQGIIYHPIPDGGFPINN